MTCSEWSRTQADSVCYFVDTKITYTPRETPAQRLVRETLDKYPRLLGLTVYAVRPGGKEPVVIASKDEREIGQTGGKTELDVIRHGTSYFGRGKQTVVVTAALRDRNGDPMAAVRVVMKSFPGQTQENAVVRAQPIMGNMQRGVTSLDDFLN